MLLLFLFCYYYILLFVSANVCATVCLYAVKISTGPVPRLKMTSSSITHCALAEKRCDCQRFNNGFHIRLADFIRSHEAALVTCLFFYVFLKKQTYLLQKASLSKAVQLLVCVVRVTANHLHANLAVWRTNPRTTQNSPFWAPTRWRRSSTSCWSLWACRNQRLVTGRRVLERSKTRMLSKGFVTLSSTTTNQRERRWPVLHSAGISSVMAATRRKTGFSRNAEPPNRGEGFDTVAPAVCHDCEGALYQDRHAKS